MRMKKKLNFWAALSAPGRFSTHALSVQLVSLRARFRGWVGGGSFGSIIRAKQA